MGQDQNPFGGGNPNSIYVPMSEDEQEVLQRLADSSDIKVIIHGWGHIESPPIIVGDARVSVVLDLTFHAPAEPIPVRYFDLELQTGSGVVLFKNRQLVMGGEPMMIGAGIHLVFAWDIMIHHMDPKLVKMLKPGTIGLTSRRLDKDTGEATLTGNMDVTARQKKLLRHIQAGEESVKQQDQAEVVEATLKSGHQVKKTTKGIETPTTK